MKVLVVDDDSVTLHLLREYLEGHGVEVCLADGVARAVELFQLEQPDVVLSDIKMNLDSGFDLIEKIRKFDSAAVVILMTGFGSMEGTIEAIQKGAFDYISKPFDLKKLYPLIKKAFHHRQDLRRNQANVGMASPALETPRTLIGKSEKIIEVYKILARATLSASSVLITGESGTGKELVARAIHENSTRKKKAFVAVNCGALTDSLLESELFGSVRGAFTGSHGDKRGLFEEANGGTLFLDEIGDISPAMQVKILRAVQNGEIKPVGSPVSRSVDVRMISASHKPIEKMVESGQFRDDLYYRLKVIEIFIPPLRERREDIAELATLFLKMVSRQQKKRVEEISNAAMQKLTSYSWPGNVRELEHQIERAVTLTSSRVLEPDDFSLAPDWAPPEGVNSTSTEIEGVELSLDAIEKRHILRVLQETHYNKSKASEVLGIDRATLYRKAQRYGIVLQPSSS